MLTCRIYIRKMRFEAARSRLLREIDRAFLSGIVEAEVIHGVGDFILKKMVIEEISKLDYAKIKEDLLQSNPGITRVIIEPPDPAILKSIIG